MSRDRPLGYPRAVVPTDPAPPRAPHRSDLLLLGALVASGAAALGYEILWTRILGLYLGSEALGVFGVLAGFFGGMALGSFWLHDRARRCADPIWLFAKLELFAAFFAAVSPYLLHAVGEAVPAWIGPGAGRSDEHVLIVTVLVSGLLLLPGTVCLGATLPVAVEAHRRAESPTLAWRGVGRLYASHTLGATLGTLGSVYVVLPALGFDLGALALASLAVVAVVLATRYGHRHPEVRCAPVEDPTVAVEIDCSRDPDPDVVSEPRLLVFVAFASGIVGVGLEVVGVVVLGQVFQNTVYTFADTLAVYLVGTAIGAWLYQRFAERIVRGRPATILAGLLIALSISVVTSAVAMARASDLMDALAPRGASYEAHLWAEGVLALAVFGAPTVLMGAFFSHVVGLLARQGVGRAYAANTLGSAIAPFAFGLVAIPSLGYRDALFAVVYGYLAIFSIFTWFRRFRPLWQIGSILAVVLSTSLSPSTLVLVDEGIGATVLASKQTVHGVVSVAELRDPAEGQATAAPRLRRLRVGQHFRMGGARSFGERRMGHIPLLLAPHTASALYLGVATGATMSPVVSGGVTRAVGVELIPEILELLPQFAEINERLYEQERVELVAADARRYVAASAERFDVVVADLFHPARDSASTLFAREHFEHVRDHLEDTGIFVQWLPLHQLEPEHVRVIVRTFLAVFPEVHSILAFYNVETPSIGLIGGKVPLRVSQERLTSTLAEARFAGLLELRELLGGYMLDRAALERFAGEGPQNTDLRPRILFDTPRSTYEAKDSLRWTSLESLLSLRSPLPADLLVSTDRDAHAALLAEVAHYSRAVTLYLEAELLRTQAAEAASPSTAAAPPPDAVSRYVAAYVEEPGFAPARGVLFRLASRSPELALAILPRMYERTPDEPRVVVAYATFLDSRGDTKQLEALVARAKARAAELPSPTTPSPTTPSPTTPSPTTTP